MTGRGDLAACFIEGGVAEPITIAEGIDRYVNGVPLTWVHLQGGDPVTRRSELKLNFGFSELQIEDALSLNERPSMIFDEDEVFLTLPILTGLTISELSLWARPAGIVSFSHEPNPAVEQAYERWLQSPHRLAPTVGRLMHVIIDAVVDGYRPIVESIEVRAEDVADDALRAHADFAGEVIALKKQVVQMRRILVPARDVIEAIMRGDMPFTEEALRDYFRDVLDHLKHDIESLDASREVLVSSLTIFQGESANRLNSVIRQMTVYALMLAAPTFIAGVYGMNFEHMPELRWRGGYPFALALCGASSLGIWLIFRWKGWVGGDHGSRERSQ